MNENPRPLSRLEVIWFVHALVLSYQKPRQTLLAISFLAGDQDTITYGPRTGMQERHTFFRTVMDFMLNHSAKSEGVRFDGFYTLDDATFLQQKFADPREQDQLKRVADAWKRLSEYDRCSVIVIGLFFLESLMRDAKDSRERLFYQEQSVAFGLPIHTCTMVLAVNAIRPRHAGDPLARQLEYFERLMWSTHPPQTGSEAAVIYGPIAEYLAQLARGLSSPTCTRCNRQRVRMHDKLRADLTAAQLARAPANDTLVCPDFGCSMSPLFERT